MRDEWLVPTSHVKIGSYISHSGPDPKRIRGYLLEFQRIVDTQDVGHLILLLKELIPDYNPGSRLLKLALSSVVSRAGTAEIEISA